MVGFSALAKKLLTTRIWDTGSGSAKTRGFSACIAENECKRVNETSGVRDSRTMCLSDKCHAPPWSRECSQSGGFDGQISVVVGMVAQRTSVLHCLQSDKMLSCVGLSTRRELTLEQTAARLVSLGNPNSRRRYPELSCVFDRQSSDEFVWAGHFRRQMFLSYVPLRVPRYDSLYLLSHNDRVSARRNCGRTTMNDGMAASGRGSALNR